MELAVPRHPSDFPRFCRPSAGILIVHRKPHRVHRSCIPSSSARMTCGSPALHVGHFGLIIGSIKCARQAAPPTSDSSYTATVRAAVNPPDTLPVTVASSSDEPSLNTLSVASVTRDMFETLASYPDVA